ncbi:MAG: hypothetical protein R2854_03260 [Caldilineaceae bacterium]
MPVRSARHPRAGRRGDRRLRAPRGVAVAADGTAVVVDSGGTGDDAVADLLVISSDRADVRTVASGDAALVEPFDVALADDDGVLVLDPQRTDGHSLRP